VCEAVIWQAGAVAPAWGASLLTGIKEAAGTADKPEASLAASLVLDVALAHGLIQKARQMELH
jgi:hypothetical protein